MAWIQSPVVYAALGDSMSIDDYAGGPGRGVASLLWRNLDDPVALVEPGHGRRIKPRHPAARVVPISGELRPVGHERVLVTLGTVTPVR